MLRIPQHHSAGLLGLGMLLAVSAANLTGCGSESPAASSPSAFTAEDMNTHGDVVATAVAGEASPAQPTSREESSSGVNADIQGAMPALLGALGEDVSASELPAPVSVDPVQLKQARDAFDTLTTPDVATSRWEEAHQTLLQMGEGAVPVLVEELRHEDAFHRETAAMTLALMGTPAPSAIAPLQEALRDESQFVRANVATALILSPEHAQHAVPVLVELLEADDSQLRLMAASNLAAVGEEAASHVAELTRTIGEETSPEVLLPVVELLGRIGPAAIEAVPQLKRIEFEQTGDVRNAASHALSLIQPESGN